MWLSKNMSDGTDRNQSMLSRMWLGLCWYVRVIKLYDVESDECVLLIVPAQSTEIRALVSCWNYLSFTRHSGQYFLRFRAALPHNEKCQLRTGLSSLATSGLEWLSSFPFQHLKTIASKPQVCNSEFFAKELSSELNIFLYSSNF